MKRRQLLKAAALVPFLPSADTLRLAALRADDAALGGTFSRVRPGDAAWPSEQKWQELKRHVEGRLIKVDSPLHACQGQPVNDTCSKVLSSLRNPFYIGDHPGLTQISAWVDAWTSQPSVYAVAAQKTQDVVAAVNFARENKLRLVVKGGGHSFQGTSCAPDSLLVWTRKMNAIALHEAFVPQGCEQVQPPQPAVSIEAGALWLDAYQAATTRGGRYVQGGGCTTVGVAGLIQSSVFGSFSKRYGLAAAGLLEAEVVTADGVAQIANARTNPDLFWGLKGGGGGSLGVVTRVTLRTRELPQFFGVVSGKVTRASDAAYCKLIERTMSFYADRLFNPHWGEQLRFGLGNELVISMLFQGLNRAQVEEIWKPLRDWIAELQDDYKIDEPFKITAVPAKAIWNPALLKTISSSSIFADDRPNAPAGNFAWAGDREQSGRVLYGYRSAWLPAPLLKEAERSRRVPECSAIAARHISQLTQLQEVQLLDAESGSGSNLVARMRALDFVA